MIAHVSDAIPFFILPWLTPSEIAPGGYRDLGLLRNIRLYLQM